MNTIQLRLKIEFYSRILESFNGNYVETYAYSLKHNSNEYELYEVNHNFIKKLLTDSLGSDYQKVILGEYVELIWDISQHDYDLIFTLYSQITEEL